MDRDEFSHAVDTYLLEVRRKLMRSWDKYRDTNAAGMTLDRIMREIGDEAIDIVGWGFWAWLAVERARPASSLTPPPR